MILTVSVTFQLITVTFYSFYAQLCCINAYCISYSTTTAAAAAAAATVTNENTATDTVTATNFFNWRPISSGVTKIARPQKVNHQEWLEQPRYRSCLPSNVIIAL